jgi:hypothetical protein
LHTKESINWRAGVRLDLVLVFGVAVEKGLDLKLVHSTTKGVSKCSRPPQVQFRESFPHNVDESLQQKFFHHEKLQHRKTKSVGPKEEEKMVRPERFELPTYSSGGCRSIQTELRAHKYIESTTFADRHQTGHPFGRGSVLLPQTMVA